MTIVHEHVRLPWPPKRSLWTRLMALVEATQMMSEERLAEIREYLAASCLVFPYREMMDDLLRDRDALAAQLKTLKDAIESACGEHCPGACHHISDALAPSPSGGAQSCNCAPGECAATRLVGATLEDKAHIDMGPARPAKSVKVRPSGGACACTERGPCAFHEVEGGAGEGR